MIEIKNLSAGYGKAVILHNISLTAGANEITTIIGNNGCGKSTLLKTIAGILPVSGGEILIGGKSILALTLKERAQQTAYLPQGKNTPDITAGRMVLHGRFPYLSYPRKYKKADFDIAYAAMEKMGIEDLADRPMAELSGGTRQKVYIAMALAQCSPVILMDEPTSYLDIGQQMKFIGIAKELAQSGKTVILVLHDLLCALKISDWICVMEDGKILMQSTPKEILDSGIIQKLYGVEVRTLHTPEGLQYYYHTKI